MKPLFSLLLPGLLLNGRAPECAQQQNRSPAWGGYACGTGAWFFPIGALIDTVP